MDGKNIIELGKPVRTEKRRGFQPPWYTVFIYQCQNCQKEVTMRANSFIGMRRTPSGHLAPIKAVPGVGAVSCPHCSK